MKLCVKVITDDLEVTFSSYVIVMYSLYLTKNQGYLKKKTKKTKRVTAKDNEIKILEDYKKKKKKKL